MITIDVKADIQEVQTGLKELGLELRGIGRKILRALATMTKKRIKKRMGLYIRERTGQLKGAVYGFARSPEHAVVATGRGYVAETLERGEEIKPKKAGMLSFYGNSGWRRMHSVTIPARRWFQQSSAGFEDDPEYQSTMDKVVGKAIKKAMKT